MSSPIDQVRLRKPSSHRLADSFEIWNRKLHFYLGLYFLFFVWLFALTGLLLNHHWQFAEFWPNRQVSTFTRNIDVLPQADREQQAKHLMQQLGVAGEIEWAGPRSEPEKFAFRTNRPGHAYQIKADLKQGKAVVEYTKLNGWGIAHVLHTFTGVRIGESRNQSDW